MSDLENQPAVSGLPQNDQADGQQAQLTLQLLALVLLTATVAAYFYVQQRRARFDLRGMKAPAMEFIQGAEQAKPRVDAFLAKIAEYGRTHPDFAPIMQKYQIQVPTSVPGVPAAVNPAAAKPAPAPATVPKK